MTEKVEKKIGKWDFSKLPVSEYEKVKELIAVRDGRNLLQLHEKYKLSTELYCCGGDDLFVLAYFEKGLSLNYFESE